MQVTHKADHITHAVIGGQAAQSFGINDSPEFFRILSSSLYSDKKLAVVREILCNAWDAHIEFGCTDKPVEVTVSNDQLIIRDFGPGLSPGDISKNYTTYGGTTKIANEKVTGGFGLGSKAPFAYVDHFETVSCHKGRKHIYRMSLSNGEVDGKPSVMKIMDAICGDETGIQVTIDIDATDRRTFEELVRKIARNGEMNVSLNGDIVSTLPFSQAPNGFIILPTGATGNGNSQFMVRYGHVIYPIELDQKFRAEWDRARQFLASMTNRANNWNNDSTWTVVLYAQPGEVSVTPSRETLSMTDQTIDTIKRLLADFHTKVDGKLEPECIEILKEAVTTIWADGVPGTLCNPKRMLPNKKFFERKKRELPQAIFDIRTAAWHFMCGDKYPDSRKFYVEDLKLRVQAMIDQDFGDKNLNRRFLQELSKLGKADALSPWLQKRIVWPLVRDLKENQDKGLHNPKLKNTFAILYGARDRKYGSGHIMRPITDIYLPTIAEALPFLRRVVILSHNRSEVLEDGFTLPELQNFHGELRSMFAYIVPRQPAKVKEAKAFFESRGFTVLDITPEQVIEKDPDAPKAVAKPRRKGVPTLKSFINPEDGSFDPSFGYWHNDDSVLTETPEFVTMISPQRINVSSFQGTCESAFDAIIRLWGDRGAACPSRASYDKLIELGAKPLELFVREQIAQEFGSNKLIETYYRAYHPANYRMSDVTSDVFTIVRNDPALRKLYKLPAPLPQREKDLATVFESYDDYVCSRQLPDLYKLRNGWDASKSFDALRNVIVKNEFIKLMNLTSLLSLIRSSVPEQSAKARKLLLFALKG